MLAAVSPENLKQKLRDQPGLLQLEVITRQ